MVGTVWVKASFLALGLLLATGRRTGPPLDACVDMRPRHGDHDPQTSPPPARFKWNVSSGALVQPGHGVEVSLEFDPGRTFKGFMMQARESETGDAQPLGVFRIVDEANSKTMQCTSANDTAAHPDNNTKQFVTVEWTAPQELPNEFRFYYTVVENFSTMWVMEMSDTLRGREKPPSGIPTYIKIHGCLMGVAWGILFPVGILIALFYRVVWPRGHWFYGHVGVMVVAVLTAVAGLVMILLHSDWKWLNTTELNIPHQVLGVVAMAAAILNPLMGLSLISDHCNIGTKWRAVYNVCHGTMGLLAQGTALCAMLLGVYILKDHPLNFDSEVVHSAVYSVSAIVAAVLMTLALYNGYHIRYHKVYPKPASQDENDLRPSKDWAVRLGAGGVILVFLSLPVAVASYFIFST